MGEPSTITAIPPQDGALSLGREEVILQRTGDAELVNSFANHPEIRPGLASNKYLDLAPAMTEANVFLFGEHGGFVFSWSAPRTYEIHVIVTEAGRGAWAFAAIQEAVAAMEAAGATLLWARVHPERREIAFFARRAGFCEVGSHTADAGDGPVAWRIFERRPECRSH